MKSGVANVHKAAFVGWGLPQVIIGQSGQYFYAGTLQAIW